jgi:hypothetical protein
MLKHTASTKTKSEVRGGGKPWKQKERVMRVQVHVDLHYGLEEVTFGPKPHIVSKRLIKRKKISYFIGFIFKEKRICFR